MNRIPAIKAVWVKPAGKYQCPMNKMVQENYIRNISEGDISNIALVPHGADFYMEQGNITMEENILKVELMLQSGGHNISEIFHPELSAHGIMLLTNPAVEMPEAYEIIPLCSTHTELINDQLLEFRFPITGNDLTLFEAYSRRRFSISAFVKNTLGHPSMFSRNLYAEFLP
jgi:hypothetical protein